MLEKRTLIRRVANAGFEAAQNHRRHVFIGDSQEIQSIRKTIERIRRSDANVLITGETGTGKEVVARQIRGIAEDGTLLPFIAVDASTIQSSTAESLLFGHEKGAFTGADKVRKGLFEEANEICQRPQGALRGTDRRFRNGKRHAHPEEHGKRRSGKTGPGYHHFAIEPLTFTELHFFPECIILVFKSENLCDLSPAC